MNTSEMQRELGRVKRISLGPEDHGIFTFRIEISFNGSGQGFGGYSLDTWSAEDKRRVGTACGMDMLMQLYTFFGVDDLSRAVGQAVYALRNSPSGSIQAIQRIEPDGGAIYYPKQIIDSWDTAPAKE